MPAKRALASLLLLALPGVAAASHVQWLGELPPESQRQQVERSTGPARHVDGSVLAWPTDPEALARSQQAMDELGGVLTASQGRWEAFDVEADIARNLGQAAAELALLEGPTERERLYGSLLLQGAAVYWAWPPQERERSPDAEVYLHDVQGQRLLRPWTDAVALFPDREPAREDLPDQASYDAFHRQRNHLLAQRRAELAVLGLPAGSEIWVDGLVVQDPARVSLVAGQHRVHLLRDGVVAVPRQLWLEPGQRLELEGLITVEDLERATERVLAGNLLELPQPVKDRVLELRSDAGSEPYYLAAAGGRGKPLSLEIAGDTPWILGEYERDTALLIDVALGAGVMASTAFQESDGATAHGAAATVLDVGGQFAWRRWAVLVELAVSDTTGRAGVEYGDVATTDNVVASSFARFTVAPGFYVLRLRPRRTSFVVAAPIGLLSPAHGGVGAQAWFGIPMGRTTWLRLGLDFYKFNELAKWVDVDGVNDPLTSISLRVGVAQKLH